MKEEVFLRGLPQKEFEKANCGVGFLCNIKGIASHKIVEDGIFALENLLHRGAVGADPKTGDGAGILIKIPDKFFRKECDRLKISLPQKSNYAVGLVFLPQEEKEREFCQRSLVKIIKEENLIFLGWREVPIDNSFLGEQAKLTQPVIQHIFIGKEKNIKTDIDFERRLYLVRKRVENLIRKSNIKQKNFFYISNLSCRTLSYKGLLMSIQLRDFFLDLKDSDLESPFCLFHARYSTNTFPTWDLAQPFRYLAHNGEINTLKGNINWFNSRQGTFKSRIWKERLAELYPIIVPGGSDSATLDNVLEFLVLSRGNIIENIMFLIPPAWQADSEISEEIKSFYEYNACLMEPWDGPASIAFCDGRYIGAILDRNGLRPSRYIVTKDEKVIMASEVGVLDIPQENILKKGRLGPGQVFSVDMQEGKIFFDSELKEKISQDKPYKKWIEKNLIYFESISEKKIEKKNRIEEKNLAEDNLWHLAEAFGYTREDLEILIKPMAKEAYEPTGSMGDDTPLAVLSEKPRLLFDYFKQLFAQVTNPAIDPIREELVMSLDTYLGREKNLLERNSSCCKRLKIKRPILTDKELLQLCSLKSFPTKRISLLFTIEKKDSFKKNLDKICKEAEVAVKKGYKFILLSDKGVNSKVMALPSLLAVGGVHHHLVKRQLRTKVSILIETAEPREVAHFALLFGYGADCINPYLALAIIKKLCEEKEIGLDYETAQKNYFKALEKGILKILSKMGISTLQSYRGAQIFEAVGLGEEVIEKCFVGTTSRIGGIDFSWIAKDVFRKHHNAFSDRYSSILPSGGLYQWKKDGEYHLWNPQTIFLLHQAVRNNDFNKYLEFAEIINNQKGHLTTLRGLFRFRKNKPISLSEVESPQSIIKRFVTGAMSFGSISKEAHETIAIALNRLGARSNCGEGGEDPTRFIPLANGDNLCSATKQVASGRFGVTINYLVNAKELQIKIAQGAKPGEGGQLPGHKVSIAIAKTRYTTPGVTLISPPPHHDIYSIEDLAQLIFDLKNANPEALISVKLVSEIGVGTIAAGVAKGHADIILISGGDGGTGASPLSSIKHAGLPWELGLSETQQVLVCQNLRSRVKLQVDGKLLTGKDVVVAAMLGAEEFGFGSVILVVLGCVMLRHCHLNNCSVGIATQDECLRKRFSGKPEYIENYFRFLAEEIRLIMAQLGIRRIEELIGRTDLLEINNEILHPKAKTLNLSRILYRPPTNRSTEIYCTSTQDHGIDKVLDLRLIYLCKEAIEKKKPISIELPIRNSNRAVGTMLSYKVTKFYGEEGLPSDTIKIKFKGTAGQSFGAFLAKGVTLELEGDANDYVGKGLSGGKIIIYPPKEADFSAEENVIVGNVCFYGAISGEAYICGIAGERFCIRNSGIYAVVEGVGDHGCEYMTGGRVVVLGKTGKNFAAGMSGGIAYVYDEDGKFSIRCNKEMVELDSLNQEDIETIKKMLSNHYKYTQSKKASYILNNFSLEIRKFIKVFPIEYKRILKGQSSEIKPELVEVSDG